MKKRRTVRALAKHTNIPKSTVQNRLKAGDLNWHSSSIQPLVSPKNEVQRLRHCISCIIPATILDDPQFCGFYDIIHVDEKWFYITEETQRVILVPGEQPPHRT